MKLVIGILAFVLLAGGAWYAANRDTQQPAVATENTEPVAADDVATSVEAEPLSGLGTLQSILMLGKQVKCDFTTSNESGTTAGTFYTDGDRFRTTATHNSDGLLFESNMLNDSAFIYVWGASPDGSMAIKMPVPEPGVDDRGFNTDATGGETVDLDQEVSYDCDRWQVDTSLLVPPTGVEFMDMATLMQGFMQEVPDGIDPSFVQ